MNANVNRRIGEGLRAWRTERNMTQEELAERMGKAQSYVSKTETGERGLHIAEIFEYAHALGAYWDDLMLDVSVWAGWGGDGRRVGGGKGPEE